MPAVFHIYHCVVLGEFPGLRRDIIFKKGERGEKNIASASNWVHWVSFVLLAQSLTVHAQWFFFCFGGDRVVSGLLKTTSGFILTHFYSPATPGITLTSEIHNDFEPNHKGIILNSARICILKNFTLASIPVRFHQEKKKKNTSSVEIRGFLNWTVRVTDCITTLCAGIIVIKYTVLKWNKGLEPSQSFLTCTGRLQYTKTKNAAVIIPSGAMDGRGFC